MHDEVKAGLLRVRGLNRVVICPPDGTSYLGLGDFLCGLKSVLNYPPPLEKPLRLLLFIGKIASLLPRKFLSAAVAATSFGFKYYSSGRARLLLGWRPKKSPQEVLSSV